ncbi:hypothetical protein [Streptomyces finlayi]|uniref:hypothetical protein n=1 Tax=Streptomyces finlayi TaxID=67296 RepID=UPI00162630F2|nr:hypothetical protein [Streptomyces finlayi]
MLPPSVVGDEAEHVDATNWPQILALCSLLEHLAPNPVVTLNRAAVAMVHGPAAGPDLPATLDSDWRTAHHHRLLAVRAVSWNKLGDHEAAAHAYREAARRTSSTSERRHLTSRTARLTPDRTDQQRQSADVLLVHHRRARSVVPACALCGLWQDHIDGGWLMN